MGALLGVAFAGGILLMFAAWRTGSVQPDSTPKTRRIAWSLTLRRLLLYSAGGAAAGFLLTQLPIVALIGLVAGAAVPQLLSRRTARREALQRRAAWPDVVDSLVSAVRAGMSLPEAVCGVSERGPQCLREPFAAFAADYRATGRFEASLIRLRDRLADPVSDRISEALLAARDVGGTDLGRMLRTLSDFLRQDLRLRGEAEARYSWTVNGARMAAAAPWLVLVLLSTRPGTIEAFQSAAGMLVLLFAAALTAFAYWLMSTIGRLPQDRRTLG